MQYKTLVGLVILSLLASSEALRILVCFPLLSRSHSILGHAVSDRLLEAGHEVVHITSYPRNKQVANLTEMNIAHIGQALTNNSGDGFKLKNLIGQTNLGDSLFFGFYTYKLHKDVLEDQSVVEFLSDPNQKFDAVILEWVFSELHSGIANLFECPLIWLDSSSASWQSIRIMDEIPNPAYTIDLYATNRPPLSFWQRAGGLWKIVKKAIVLDLILGQFEKWTFNSIYGEIAAKRGVTMPSYSEAAYNGSLMFVNSHPSIGGAMAYPPSVIDIGGYHIGETKPLPKDLQKLMDEAKHGVIYFSMGSSFFSDGMSEEMRKSLLDIFSKYKQTVIWKYESDLTDVPANVHLVKWAPQTSILNHTKLKLFITHGGQLSTTEALHYGVPLVGVPLMGDQIINMYTVEAKGYGIKVELREDMAPELDAAVKKILTDDSYKNTAKELSSIYHDRAMPPGAELVHWVEHVVSTRGAPHLRSLALHVSFFQRMYLDIIFNIFQVFQLISLLKFAKRMVLKIKNYFYPATEKTEKEKTS